MNYIIIIISSSYLLALGKVLLCSVVQVQSHANSIVILFEV